MTLGIFFPIELAVQHFQKSLLARARPALIKDIIRGLTVAVAGLAAVAVFV